MNASKLLVLIALVLFILAAIGFDAGRISVGWAGLAFLAGSLIV